MIGSPMDLEGAVTTGIVSAIRELGEGQKLLQITAPISKGSSGSPVFNRKGEVIGIVSFYLSEGQNLNFAVPVNALKALLKKAAAKPKPLSEGLGFSHSLVMRALEQTFQEAIQAARSVENDVVRSSALRDISGVMAKADFLEQAIQVVRGIEDAFERSSALCLIATVMVEAGQKEKAISILEQVTRVARNIEDPFKRTSLLRSIAEAMAKAGLFERAFEVAKGIEEPIHRLQALATIVAEMRKAGMIK